MVEGWGTRESVDGVVGAGVDGKSTKSSCGRLLLSLLLLLLDCELGAKGCDGVGGEGHDCWLVSVVNDGVSNEEMVLE